MALTGAHDKEAKHCGDVAMESFVASMAPCNITLERNAIVIGR